MKKNMFFILLLLVCVTMQARKKENSTSDEKGDRPKVALVLGGGGAKGAAAVGVLKYVEQSGVPIDMVVGTSIGSIVGGLYSMGTTSEQLDSLFRNRAWSDVFTGSLMGDSIVRTLRELTGSEVSFESLKIPFRCVAVDMNKMKEVVLKEGTLAQAMRASMAIPLVFKPVKMGNMKLVDGGVLNNLPVDVARDMGADIVIAVDLTVNKHKDDSSLLTLLRPDLRKYQRNCKDADIYINPNLKGYGSEDFSPTKIAEMITLGEKAGKASLKDLKKLKKKLK